MTTFTYLERFKTVKGVFDQFTERSLFELQSHHHFDELLSPLFIGKESNVFSAKKGQQKVIVKIYRLQNRDFKRMFNYIKKDPRYQNLKNKNREIILAWTQREYKNLLKAQKAGINSPQPLAIKNNVIIETLIGSGQPAPKLKDCIFSLPSSQIKQIFDEIILQVRKLYQAGLIHGDLSSFNILFHQGRPYFIDFSQATLAKTPNSGELLERDLGNIIHFFQKLGIKAKLEETLKKIAGK